jgi:histidinol-phosphate aminotransferase
VLTQTKIDFNTKYACSFYDDTYIFCQERNNKKARQARMSDASNSPTPKPSIMKIASYVPGRSEAKPGVKVHKLSSNETPLEPSPSVIEACRKALANLPFYPDGSASKLREMIAETHGIERDRIVCGNGSDELIGLLARLYLDAGDEVVLSQYGFLVYRIQALANGATPVLAPDRDYCADVDALIARITDRTKIVFLANPGNPTGTYISRSEVERLLDSLPKHVLLVIDAAYAEYVQQDDYSPGAHLVEKHDNVVMLRTLSKIYGLAGLRVGWMYAPAPIVDAINRIRGPFNLNSLAIAAGCAALKDREHVQAAIRHNSQWLSFVTATLRKIGLTFTPSVCNFVLIHFPNDEPSRSASAADEFLTARGYVLRPVRPYGLNNALRMTIGSEEANRGAMLALSEFMSKAR